MNPEDLTTERTRRLRQSLGGMLAIDGRRRLLQNYAIDREGLRGTNLGPNVSWSLHRPMLIGPALQNASFSPSLSGRPRMADPLGSTNYFSMYSAPTATISAQNYAASSSSSSGGTKRELTSAIFAFPYLNMKRASVSRNTEPVAQHGTDRDKVDDSQGVKRYERPDLLLRTRETMMLKPGKEPKSQEEQELRTKKNDSNIRSLPIKKRKRAAFPWPHVSEGKKSEIKIPLRSYHTVWTKLGGYKNKERFQRLVQNAQVPMKKRRTSNTT